MCRLKVHFWISGGVRRREGLGRIGHRCSRGSCAGAAAAAAVPGLPEESSSFLQLLLIWNAVFLLSVWSSIPLNIS